MLRTLTSPTRGTGIGRGSREARRFHDAGARRAPLSSPASLDLGVELCVEARLLQQTLEQVIVALTLPLHRLEESPGPFREVILVGRVSDSDTLEYWLHAVKTLHPAPWRWPP